MKSKKLFAILTLVAFMMTLVPAFAFAASTWTYPLGTYNYSASASDVEAVDESVDFYVPADPEFAQITLTFEYRNSEVANETVYFYAKANNNDLVGYVTNDEKADFDDATKVFDYVDESAISRGSGQFFEAKTNADGEVYFFVNSYEVGEFEIKFYDGPADTEEYPDSNLIGAATIDVETSGDAQLSLKAEIEKLEGAEEANLTSDATLAVDRGSFKEDDDDPGVYEIAKIEIGDEINLTATVKDKSNKKLEGEVVIFKKSVNGGSFTTIAEVETDKNGEAELDVEETRTGQYRYRAYLKSDNDVKTTAMDNYYFTWAAGRVAKVVAKSDLNAKRAIGKSDLEFYLYDANGNLIKADGTEAKLVVEDSPRGSKVDDVEAEVDKNGVVTFPDVIFDKEGTYEFTVEVDDKDKLEFTIEAQEFDEAVSMKIKLDSDKPSMLATDTDVSLVVTLIDEDGVEKEITDGNGLKFGSSNRSEVTIDKNGKITVVDPEDFTGTVTLTVLDEDSGVSAEFELNVVGEPVSFNPVINVVGKTAHVELQYVDNNGNRTYTDEDGGGKLSLILPSGVTSESVEDFDEDTGIAEFDLVAAKAGEYTIVANSSVGITKSFKVAFEVPASEKVVVGAKNVTMFIGNTAYVQDGVAKVTDVAPFIKDDRTFVAIRPVADAFGCEIGWDEATQTVTLTRDDLTVTIVIGSSDIAVVKDGVTSTITADVPAFIQNGRTVLPFRAIGNAFGATVNYDAATQSVSYVQE